MGRRNTALSQLRVCLPALLAAATLACATPTPPGPVPAPDGEPVVTPTSLPQDPGAPSDPSADPVLHPVPAQAQTSTSSGGTGLGKRAESAMEGLIVGTVIGGQIGGTYGAGIGAVLFGLYGLLTGDVPFDTSSSSRPKGPRSSDPGALEGEIDAEVAKADELEAEIEEQLRRQEELLGQIEKQEALQESLRDEEIKRLETEPDDPLAAPNAPHERNIPDSIFDIQKNPKTGEITKTLDADRDGRSEIEIEMDKMGRTRSRAEDTNYDGLLDAYNTYEAGQISERSEDTNHDGVPDRWVTYENGRGSREEVDRDYDGRRDGFRTYRGGYISLEEHDADNDGRIDRRVEYEGRARAVEFEDTDRDGDMDMEIYYDREGLLPIRIERDTTGDGKTENGSTTRPTRPRARFWPARKRTSTATARPTSRASTRTAS